MISPRSKLYLLLMPFTVALLFMFTCNSSDVDYSVSRTPPPPIGEPIEIVANPLPIDPMDSTALPEKFRLAAAEVNGVQVVMIKINDEGDELIIDAKTGKLLRTIPSIPVMSDPMSGLVLPPDLG